MRLSDDVEGFSNSIYVRSLIADFSSGAVRIFFSKPPETFSRPTQKCPIIIFESAFLRDVVLAATETRLSLLRCFLPMRWFNIVYGTIFGRIPEIVGLLIRNFHCQRTLPMLPAMCMSSFSAKSLFVPVCFLTHRRNGLEVLLLRKFQRNSVLNTPSQLRCQTFPLVLFTLVEVKSFGDFKPFRPVVFP